MKEFEIEIQETLSKALKIKAKNLEEAISETQKLYKDEKIVLTSDDFLDYEIKPLN